MDEGWTRWLFDQNGIPYTRVVDADMRKGDLNRRFDVLILPDQAPNVLLHGSNGPTEGGGWPPPAPEYLGGLGEDGIRNLRAFAWQGGTVIALNRASLVYSEKNLGGVTNVLSGVASKDFYVPGSILEVAADLPPGNSTSLSWSSLVM